MAATDDIHRSLRDHLADLEHEAALLRGALAALKGGSPRTSTRSAATKSTPKPKRPEPASVPTVVAPAGKLERLLSGTAGLTTNELCELANADPGQVIVLLREMEAAGKLTRTGQRGGTRWHLQPTR